MNFNIQKPKQDLALYHDGKKDLQSVEENSMPATERHKLRQIANSAGKPNMDFRIF